MNGAGQGGAFEGGSLWVIGGEGNANFGREFPDAPDGRGDHFFFDANGGAAKVDAVALGIDAHDGDHAGAKCGGAEVGRRKGFAFAVVIHRRICEKGASGRTVPGLRAEAAEIFDVD